LDDCAWAEGAVSGWADCLAEAGIADTKSAAIDASKRNRMIGFTANLPREIPCEDIESQVVEKVSGNCCGKVRPESTGDRPRGSRKVQLQMLEETRVRS
jgi:hypothetical protein